MELPNLSKSTIKQLSDIHNHVVKLTGKNIKVLLTGPSGTEKTLAASWLASKQGQSLYKVDLAASISKYIGETEKNLTRLLASAENSGNILFFDEADALFGKRTEVTDSHNRFSNTETGYLLRGLEKYPGVVILTTHHKSKIDDTVLQSMDFIVDIQPQRKPRKSMWQRIKEKLTQLFTGK